MSPTVVVGSGHGADDLAQWLNDGPYAGYAVVATVAAPVANQTSLSGWLDSLDNVITETGATAITLAPAEQSPSGLVKELAWRLEGRRIDLLIAPGMLDIAGPRLHIRPAAGLPLLHLEEAVLSRFPRFLLADWRRPDMAGLHLRHQRFHAGVGQTGAICCHRNGRMV
jgi:hypothetical protein